MPTLFIGGTDTGVGKTWVTAGLLRQLRGAGLRAAGYKPVAAGCEHDAEGWRNEDALALQAAGEPGLAYAQINPCALPEPLAPHIAAARAGMAIDLPALAKGARALAAQHDWLLVEGAGGLRVPLAAGVDALDWVAEQGWPVLLVVGMRLGCLNHALLSAEVLSARGLRWTWLANPLPPRQPALEENLQTLQEWMPGSCLRLDQQDWLAQLQAFAGE